MASISDVDQHALAAALKRRLEGGVRVDPYTLHMYATDASMYYVEPLAVAFPRSVDDVAATVGVARDYGVPVIARGAGTSLAGQTVGRAVVLDVSRHMDEIIAIDPVSRAARVQPGVVQSDLSRAAARYGLMFGPDTSTSNRATLGGMIGNNSSGSQSVRYGTTLDHVLALEVVLSDGSRAGFERLDRDAWSARAALPTLEGAIYRGVAELVEAYGDTIARHFPKAWRHSGGYRLDRLIASPGDVDLSKLVVGSEGTLVIATEALVNLVERPAAHAVAVGHFHSVLDAIAATEDALAEGAAAVELMDRTILQLARQNIEYARLAGLLRGDPGALMFVSFVGEDDQATRSQAHSLARTWRHHGHGYHTLAGLTAPEQATVLKVRKASLGFLMAASTGRRRPLAFVEDTAVPPARLHAYVARLANILDRHGLRAGFYGHCSVGCLHIRPFVDVSSVAEIDTMRSVSEEVLELVLEFGGVNSSEHGDGRVRSEFNRRMFGDEVYAAMRSIKQLFDPDNRLNPGKIVDAVPMTADLRDRVLRVPRQPIESALAFAESGGMFGAADRCMNIGLCRKTDAGVMCPSYMATRDEEASTRGRANALVKALSTGDLSHSLADKRVHEILDLCLECKACKVECPLGVDMAALKSAFLARYQELNGTPLRSRFFAHIRQINEVCAPIGPILNWATRRTRTRALMDRHMGVARQRPLPAFERSTLMNWHASREPPRGLCSNGTVVFLADSFTSYFEPHIGRACIELLEAAGWRVVLEAKSCCGRAAISKGVLGDAARSAQALTRRMNSDARRGLPIVGCEPSCLLTLRDEYPRLLPDSADVMSLGARARPATELLLEALDDGRLRLASTASLRGRRVVLHSHCHEKALVGTETTRQLLARIPGVEVEEIDSGCCGMAGSFGYEAEHYDLSMRIGSLRLFPAISTEPPDTIVAATGFSCRQQIAHGTSRRPRHPAELIRAALA
jgi:FAD/FMN-containing dehydrogenase/Fe-S oxidoreductase